jgi:hypothetical protein
MNEQGIINEPTNCPYGDQIPLNSEKCVPPTAPPELPKVLPKTGAHFEILLPILCSIVFIAVVKIIQAIRK